MYFRSLLPSSASKNGGHKMTCYGTGQRRDYRRAIRENGISWWRWSCCGVDGAYSYYLSSFDLGVRELYILIFPVGFLDQNNSRVSKCLQARCWTYLGWRADMQQSRNPANKLLFSYHSHISVDD